MIDTNNLYLAISLTKDDVGQRSFSQFGGNPVGIRKSPESQNDQWIFLDGLYGIHDYFYGRVKKSYLIANSVQNKIEKLMNQGIFKGSVKMPPYLGGDIFYFEIYNDSEKG